MFQGVAYEAVDLGADVRAEEFVAAVRTESHEIFGMSPLLTTTMTHIPVTVHAPEKAGMRQKGQGDSWWSTGFSGVRSIDRSRRVRQRCGDDG